MFLYDCCVIKLRGVLLVGESVSAVSSSLGEFGSVLSCTPRCQSRRCRAHQGVWPRGVKIYLLFWSSIKNIKNMKKCQLKSLIRKNAVTTLFMKLLNIKVFVLSVYTLTIKNVFYYFSFWRSVWSGLCFDAYIWR